MIAIRYLANLGKFDHIVSDNSFHLYGFIQKLSSVRQIYFCNTLENFGDS